MSAQHTPGPWFVVPKDAPKGTLMVACHFAEKKPLVCVLEHSKTGPVSYEQAEKNAFLIAGAPDMLEELQYLVSCSAPMTPQQSECWVGIRAAIAKATGVTE